MAQTAALGLTLVLSLVIFAGCTEEGAQDPGSQDEEAVGPFNGRAHVVGDSGKAEWTKLPDGATSTNGTYYQTGTTTFEPSIVVSDSGALFFTNFGGTGRGTHIYRSTDEGQTWEDVGPFLTGDTAQFPSSNDPFIAIDEATNRIFKFDMHALTCMTFEYSDDEGETWSKVTPACGTPPAAQDHQAMWASKPREHPTVGYDSVLTYCVNRGTGPSGAWCSSSFDGGLSWTPLAPGFPASTLQCAGLHHHLRSDSEGRIYRPGAGCDGATVWRSEDDGITWTEHPIPKSKMRAGEHDVALSIDEANNLHALWIGDKGKPMFASSKDHGETWTVPILAGRPDVKSSGFPAIAAGAAGRVAFAYIAELDKSSGGKSDEWHGVIGYTLDAFAEDRVFVSTLVNDPEKDPLSEMEDCGSVRCEGFGDFIGMVVDPKGRPFVAFAHGDDAVIGSLSEGPALRGDLKALNPLPNGEPL